MSVSRLPFWLIVLLLALGYGLTAVLFPLIPHLSQIPLPDVRTFTPSLWQGALYGLGFLLLTWLYWQASQRPPTLPSILATAVLFALPLLLTFPINATDVYGYFLHGRVSSVYGANPFLQAPSAFSQDPFWPLVGEWADETTPYGPLWELVATAVAALARNNLLLGILLFKVVGLITHLGIAWLIWQLLADQEATLRRRATLLWAWNPALLVTFVVDAHNDGFMLFWLLLGYWLAQNGRCSWPLPLRLALSFTLLCLAPLSKLIGLLPLPFFFLAFWRQGRNTAERLRFFGLSLAGGLLLLWLAFLPFGSPIALFARLLREATQGAGFSITALLLLLDQRLALGLSWSLLVNVMRALAVVGGLWWVWRVWNGRSPLQATAAIFTLYILQALNFRIWYSTWAFPFLLLLANSTPKKTNHPITQSPNYPITNTQLQASLLFLLTSQLSVLIYGHLRLHLFHGDHFPAHLIGVPFTFGLPLLLAWYKNLFTETN